jgi:sulfite reductase alpha subunit-like flavoprotein
MDSTTFKKVSLSVIACSVTFYLLYKLKQQLKNGTTQMTSQVTSTNKTSIPATNFKIIYASQNGTGKRMALELATLLGDAKVLEVQEYEWEDLPKEQSKMIFILSTYHEGIFS